MKKAVTFILALCLCLSLAVPAMAAGMSIPAPYGSLQFQNAAPEGSASYNGETVKIYSMTPSAYLYKYGISESTLITVYYAEVKNGAVTRGDIRFQRGADYFREIGFGDETYWSYYFDPEDVGIYRFIEIVENNLGKSTRFVLHCVSQIADDNKCGENLTWELKDGTLTVRGTGAMYDYRSDQQGSPESNAPWIARESEIKHVVVENGVTSIGDCAFLYCQSIESVRIADSVKRIGDYAFYGDVFIKDFQMPAKLEILGKKAVAMCEFAPNITLPATLTSIGEAALYDTASVTSYTWPEKVTSIGNSMFLLCGQLQEITIPATVTSIGIEAFFLCNKLTDVYFGGTRAAWDAITVAERNDSLAQATIHCADDAGATTFSDVKPTDYFAEAVAWAVQNGITKGVGGGKFGATDTVQRAQAVTFLWRAAGEPEPKTAKSPFTDVTDPTQWYYKAVLWAAEKGITNGVGNDKFGLDGTLAYDQMLTFMCRAAGGDTSGDWSAKALAWAKDKSMTEGLNVTAKGDCPRSDVVYCLWKQMA